MNNRDKLCKVLPSLYQKQILIVIAYGIKLTLKNGFVIRDDKELYNELTKRSLSGKN